jgi:hypothetical protein
LSWTLSSHEEGQKRVLHQGESDLTRLVHQRFLTLEFPAVQFDRATQVELAFHAPPADSGLYAEFPTFASPPTSHQELNLFFFTKPAAVLAETPAGTRR